MDLGSAPSFRRHFPTLTIQARPFFALDAPNDPVALDLGYPHRPTAHGGDLFRGRDDRAHQYEGPVLDIPNDWFFRHKRSYAALSRRQLTMKKVIARVVCTRLAA